MLHLHASPKAADAEQMFAAGYLEGWLTAERIYDHFFNMRAFFNMTTPKPMQWCGHRLPAVGSVMLTQLQSSSEWFARFNKVLKGAAEVSQCLQVNMVGWPASRTARACAQPRALRACT